MSGISQRPKKRVPRKKGSGLDRQIQDLMLCESRRLLLRPGILYRFTADPTCSECKRLALELDPPNTPHDSENP